MKKLLITSLLFALCLSVGFSVTKREFIYSLPNDVGIVNTLDNWQDLPAISTATILNSVTITTQTLVASATTYTLALGDYTDVVFPRSITADAYFSTGESTTTVTGTLNITGKDQFGKAQTESLSISTNSVNGVKVWSSITQLAFTEFTISSASTDAQLAVGTGLKIALSNNAVDSGDIIKVIENGATSTTYSLDYTNDAITFAVAPDGSKDYYLYYNPRTEKTRYLY